MSRLPAAVLFDLDGTVADTEPLWIEAKAAVAQVHGIPWSEADAEEYTGRPTPDYAAEFVRRGAAGGVTGVADEITRRVAEGVRAGVPWRPGALDLLAALAEAEVPTALVTMAYRPVAEAIATATGLPVFGTIIAGDDVTRSKPHPEPYLRGLRALGQDAARCVAIEDSDTGARSAEAAGLVTLLVAETPIGASATRVHRRSLAGIGPADLGALLG